MCALARAVKTSPLRRVPQAFDKLETLRYPPAGLIIEGVQACRKRDPFSPQARWGDDGARQGGPHEWGYLSRRPNPQAKKSRLSGRLMRGAVCVTPSVRQVCVS